MARVGDAIPVRLERRMCLRCGFDGRVLQGDRGELMFRCPSCKADLYARPPRSYAEMEGLIEAPATRSARTRSIITVRQCVPASRPRLRINWRIVEMALISTVLLLLTGLCLADLIA